MLKGLAVVVTALAALFTVSTVPAFSAGVQHVGAHQASKLLKANSSIIVLDVRSAREFRSGHIRRAKNINYYSKNFRRNLAKLDRSATYLLHCRRGVRSSRTLPIMKALGFTSIIHLKGGIDSWKRAKLKVTKNEVLRRNLVRLAE